MNLQRNRCPIWCFHTSSPKDPRLFFLWFSCNNGLHTYGRQYDQRQQSNGDSVHGEPPLFEKNEKTGNWLTSYRFIEAFISR